MAWLYEQTGIRLTPLQILSTQYIHSADHQQQMAWIYQGQAMPMAQAVAAALAGDENPPARGGAGPRGTDPAMQEDLARTEARLQQILESARTAPEPDSRGPDPAKEAS
jgi:hypothetical protein